MQRKKQLLLYEIGGIPLYTPIPVIFVICYLAMFILIFSIKEWMHIEGSISICILLSISITNSLSITYAKLTDLWKRRK